MTHWIMLIFVEYFMKYAWGLNVNLKSPIQFLIMTGMVLTISRLSFNYIEKPGKKFIKGMGK
ncbi:hypothetical protein BI347_01245 [Chromobacterium sphagni]|uniref:Uncharacterized protein n=1 Tax=Chromobacterium sphagni TaxID=1903179 RepID=A0A1S1WYS9_9NEIS|nr:hypothetical protein BI347_01245 [Chromobacterium sphagni]OHX21636.1 hypothetical protein BI344_03765 [Chromobacterium sphagni]